MSEPTARADEIQELPSGILHWTVPDDRIGARSDAYAILTPEGTVLIDPLPLTDRALGELGRPTAICLTIQSHQRSAWRYRTMFAARVHAPRGADGLEERPDEEYGPNQRLPGGLLALHAPGPCEASYVFFLERPSSGGVLFLGDLLVRSRSGFGFVPDEYQDDPALARESARRLLDVAVHDLCPGHGAPLLGEAQQAIEEALRRDAQRRKR